MFWDIFKRKRKVSHEKLLTGSVIVSPKDFEDIITIKVPIRCKDGNVVIEEKEMSKAVARAVDTLFLRVAYDYEKYLFIEKKNRKKTGKVKLIAAMKVVEK